MKIVALGLFLLTNLVLFAQKPEKVYSIVREQRDSAWYATQEQLWAKEIKKNKKNVAAWSNYYEAIRAQKNLLPWESEKRNEYTKKLDEITDELYKTNPNSFEANFYMYRHYGGLGSKDNDKYFKYLEKAYQIDPLDPRTYEDFFIYYEINRNTSKFSEFCQKFYSSNYMAPYFFNWSHNLLSGLDKNAVLLVAGDNDTYACWMVQEALNYRTDVQVINTSLITIDDYRTQLFQEMGLKDLGFRLDTSSSREMYDEGYFKLFDALFQNEKNYPVYVSSTAIRQFEQEYDDSLYLTGLAYRYADESFDNTSIIKRNIEKRYHLDYINAYFGFHIQNSKKHHLDATYLPAMIKLYKHYKLSEDAMKAQSLDSLITTIAKNSDQLEEVEKLMAE